MKALCELTTSRSVLASSLPLHILLRALALHVLMCVYTHTQWDPAITEMFVTDILEPHSQWILLRLYPAWPLRHISHCWLHSSPWHILFPFMPMSPLGFLPPYLSASSFSVSVDVSSSSVHFFHVVLPWGFRLIPFLTPYIIFQLYHFLFSWFSPPSVPWTQISTLDSNLYLGLMSTCLLGMSTDRSTHSELNSSFLPDTPALPSTQPSQTP